MIDDMTALNSIRNYLSDVHDLGADDWEHLAFLVRETGRELIGRPDSPASLVMPKYRTLDRVGIDEVDIVCDTGTDLLGVCEQVDADDAKWLIRILGRRQFNPAEGAMRDEGYHIR